MSELQPEHQRPVLRHLDTHEIDEPGQRGIVLIDPIGLCEGQVFVPEALVPIVARFDGRHTVESIEGELTAADVEVPTDFIPNLVRQFDEALLLHSPRCRDALERAAADFVRSGRRPAKHAGSAGYPADPNACRRALDEIIGPRATPSGRPPSGLVAPHIDLARGHEGYRAAYAHLAAHEPADLYVVFGTGHQGPSAPVTGLELDWETPVGVARTDRAFVRTIHELLDPPDPLDVLLHRGEHSMEFQVLFLTHLLGDRDFEVAAFVTGSLPRTASERQDIIDAFAKTAAASGKRVCWVAGADLAHLGPFFGDPEEVGPDLLQRLDRDERVRLGHLERGDADAFHTSVEANGNPDRVCGTSPMTLTAALAGGPGELLCYGQADADDGSQVVSFCSFAFAGV